MSMDKTNPKPNTKNKKFSHNFFTNEKTLRTRFKLFCDLFVKACLHWLCVPKLLLAKKQHQWHRCLYDFYLPWFLGKHDMTYPRSQDKYNTFFWHFGIGILLKGLTRLLCFVLLVLLMAEAKLLQYKWAQNNFYFAVYCIN